MLVRSLLLTSFLSLLDEGVAVIDFSPSLKASCVGGTMTIRVDTTSPFEGIIHGPNRTEPGCSTEGAGGLKTYLRIDLDRSGACGVKYNPSTEERRVAVAVRAHPSLELLEDKLYVVSCGRAGFQNSRNEVSVVTLTVTPPNVDPSLLEQKVTTVLEGSEYMLNVQVLEHDPSFGILVRRCFAFDDSDTSIQLVDDRGCVSETLLISPFVYDMEKGRAMAKIASMFRLPRSNRTYFQCDVAICSGQCTQPMCEESVRSASLLNDGEDDDPFERPEDDAVMTSTSVFVAQPGSEAAASAVFCNSSVDVVDDDWLLWLCVAFGILFALMLLINIFLCSAMTCSCTRSEIVEKEPSVYDDYSIYDSNYGYTNGKYGSESDEYGGSEYGHNDDTFGRRSNNVYNSNNNNDYSRH